MNYTLNLLSKFNLFYKDILKENIQPKLESPYEPAGFYKKGNKIHIKKLNKGKFTDYCGGNVTDTCILKGKNSSDPKIRKRATFAANARNWNHKYLLGGTFKLLRKIGKSLKPLKPLNSKSIASSTKDANAMVSDISRGYSSLIKWYSSPEYLKRAISKGLSEKEAKALQKSLLNNLSQKEEHKLISGIKIVPKANPGEHGHYSQSTIRSFGDPLPKLGQRTIEIWGPENFATAAHEGAHASTLQYLPESYFNNMGRDLQIADSIVEAAYPLIAKIMHINAKLLPESRGVWKPSYAKDLQEVRSRAISNNVVALENGLSIDLLFNLPQEQWTNDMIQLVNAVGLDRAKSIAKNILTLGGLTYGVSNYLGNNE